MNIAIIVIAIILPIAIKIYQIFFPFFTFFVSISYINKTSYPNVLPIEHDGIAIINKTTANTINILTIIQ